jgi:hypothetical protein
MYLLDNHRFIQALKEAIRRFALRRAVPNVRLSLLVST